jgi:alpha-tubulin suppressor-like RCC1 family protein
VNAIVTASSENRMYLAPYTMPGLADVEELNLGYETACVLHRDRRVTCWGDLDLAIRVPNAARVRTGHDFVCFHLDDGTVSCMGNNTRGVLGNGTLRSPGPLGPVHGLGPVLEMSTDFFHSCALEPGDEVWCWGQDYYDGRLGQGPSHDHPAPIRVPNLDAVDLRALAVGRDSSCVIADDGLWCWGRDLGQLSGRAPVAPTPIRIENLH